MGMEESHRVIAGCERRCWGWGEPCREGEDWGGSPELGGEGHWVRRDGSWKLTMLGKGTCG